METFGLHVSPDPDLVTYWLAGVIDEERGYGIAGESFNTFDQLVKLGHSVCFAVDGNKTDLSHGCGRASLIRMAADNASSIHWTIQSHSRARIAKRLLAGDG